MEKRNSTIIHQINTGHNIRLTNISDLRIIVGYSKYKKLKIVNLNKNILTIEHCKLLPSIKCKILKLDDCRIETFRYFGYIRCSVLSLRNTFMTNNDLIYFKESTYYELNIMHNPFITSTESLSTIKCCNLKLDTYDTFGTMSFYDQFDPKNRTLTRKIRENYVGYVKSIYHSLSNYLKRKIIKFLM